MSKVWVLGDGQLGAMLRHAGLPLAIEVMPVDIQAPLPGPLGAEDVITAEREHWPDTATARQLFDHPRFLNRRAFTELTDRRSQKEWLDKLNLATAPWRAVDESTTTEGLYQELGDAVLMKRRRGGYDGRGQYWLRKADSAAVIPEGWRGEAIAEQAIAFQEEVSLIGMRNQAGRCEFYPLTLNLHNNGILMASVAPLSRLDALQARAEDMLSQLMQAIDYVGVMAMECFVAGDQLLVNEVAPRVHNSGHWTQAGSSVSQFESHLRAIGGLPLVSPMIRNTSVMINLIGVQRDDRWLAVPGVELYWYGKEVTPGRKLGHVNVCLPERHARATALHALQSLLPDNYAATFAWLENHSL